MVRLVKFFVETHFPCVTKHRTQLPPWITPPTSHILKKLNTAKKQTSQKREKIEMLESEYKTSAEIGLASFEERNFSELNKYFRSLRKSEYLPDRMYFVDKVAKSEVEKAELFNKFFQSVFHMEVHDTIDRNINETACTINKIELTEIQISNVLTSLDPKKACGPDKIGNEICAFYLDFEKAFDKVSHNILLQKLQNKSIGGNFLAILESYLNDRKQFVEIGQSNNSTMLDVTSGVPQGSLLGPLMFIIYINDITENVNSFALGYADDYKFLSTNNEMFQDDISQLHIWCEQNLISLNADKCNMLNFKGNQKTEICGKEVKSEENQKDLGLIVTQKLSWLENAKRRVTKATKSLFFVKRNVSSKTSVSKNQFLHWVCSSHSDLWLTSGIL